MCLLNLLSKTTFVRKTIVWGIKQIISYIFTKINYSCRITYGLEKFVFYILTYTYSNPTHQLAHSVSMKLLQQFYFFFPVLHFIWVKFIIFKHLINWSKRKSMRAILFYCCQLMHFATMTSSCAIEPMVLRNSNSRNHNRNKHIQLRFYFKFPKYSEFKKLIKPKKIWGILYFYIVSKLKIYWSYITC